MNRIYLAMIGTLIWGITNIGIGMASTFRQVRLVLCSATSSPCIQDSHAATTPTCSCRHRNQGQP